MIKVTNWTEMSKRYLLTLLEALNAVEDSTSNGFPAESWNQRTEVARGRDVTVQTTVTLRSPSCAYASSQNTFGGSGTIQLLQFNSPKSDGEFTSKFYICLTLIRL